ncbi:hypothetical protein Megpolyxen_00748 [Candidatus Megaera polyxenophila]|nr:hypothetical protein Megpolyxen_00748 [Candidatus Megaera polyxenophila]
MLRKFFLAFLVLFLAAAVTIVVCGIYLYNSYLQKELISIINEVDIAAFSKDIDLSTDKTVQCKQNMTGNVWLISYADGGEVHLANQRALTASALNKCIDFYKPYNRKHIASSYVNAHENIFSHKKGAGYWLWKPYIILETLEEIPENDILLYADSGSVIAKPIDSLVNKLENGNDILVFQNKHTNRGYVRRDLLTAMGMNNDFILDSYQLQASFILIKNTNNAREFIRKWLKLCENGEALTDSESFIEEYYYNTSHRHDQAILTLLYLQHPQGVMVRPKEELKEYFLHHRRRWLNYDLLFLLKKKLNENKNF